MISVGIQDQGGNDNIKREFYIACPVNPIISEFVKVINALNSFTIPGIDIPTFKAVATDLSAITYYVELLNVGKGNYGTNGFLLTDANIKLTSFGANAKDLETLSTTQIINLGYTGVSVMDALNSHIPAIAIQDQNQGYVLIKGSFIDGVYSEYLWIGKAGTYGGEGALQSVILDFKELSELSSTTDQNNFSRVIKIAPANLSGVGTIEEQICSYINSLGYTKQDFDADVWVELDTNAVITPVNCTVSEWSDWSICRVDGTQTRTRTVLTPASNGGAFCPILFENRACTYVPPINPRTSVFLYDNPCGSPIDNLYVDTVTELYYIGLSSLTLYTGYGYEFNGTTDPGTNDFEWASYEFNNGVRTDTGSTFAPCQP